MTDTREMETNTRQTDEAYKAFLNEINSAPSMTLSEEKQGAAFLNQWWYDLGRLEGALAAQGGVTEARHVVTRSLEMVEGDPEVAYLLIKSEIESHQAFQIAQVIWAE